MIISDCLCPRVILIPESNTFETAYQYRRSQEFYILSTIKINCNKSLSTKKIWKIRNYSTIGSSDIDFDKKVSKSSSELFIPSNTLPYGIYQFIGCNSKSRSIGNISCHCWSSTKSNFKSWKLFKRSRWF